MIRIVETNHQYTLEQHQQYVDATVEEAKKKGYRPISVSITLGTKIQFMDTPRATAIVFAEIPKKKK